VGRSNQLLRQYARGAAELLHTFGEDVGQWTAPAVRNFLLERASQGGALTPQNLITSLRAFLRYLIAETIPVPKDAPYVLPDGSIYIAGNGGNVSIPNKTNARNSLSSRLNVITAILLTLRRPRAH
jgi:hypothetical protein